MRPTTPTYWRQRAGGLAAFMLAVITANAQTPPQNSQGATAESKPTLAIPGDGKLIELQVIAPREVRVADSYQYQIRVTNASDDITLHQVVISQQAEDDFEIEEASLDSPGRSDSASDDGDDKATKERSKDDKSKQAQERNADEEGADHEEKNANEWTIERLRPRESRTIHVTASSDKEGASGACVAVKSYQPAVCLQTSFVKPELELVKTAPEAAGLCEVIEFAYYIKNDGSGPTGRLTVRDELEEGLQTASGDDSLEFRVDNLEPGDTRKFVAQIHAMEPGSYSSRATVEAEKGGKARSKSAATDVRNAELALVLDGPEVEYHDRPVSYTARVSNVGNAPAPDVRLAVYSEEGVGLLRAGEPRSSEDKVESNVSEESRPIEEVVLISAEEDRPADDNRSASKASENRGWEQVSRELKVWDFGSMAPGETREVRYTVRPGDAEEIHQRALAQYVCARSDDDEQVVESMARAQTDVISMPALLVSVVDKVDPVKVGDDVVYRIVVENQGTASDEQIQLVAELPDALEFRSVDGESDAENDGQRVSFDRVDKLGPGERVTWDLRARVKEPGDVRLKIDLTSKSQEKKVRSEEPTTLFGEE